MASQPNPHRRTGMAMLAIAWLLVFAGIYWFFDGWYVRQTNPNPHAVLQSQTGQVILQRNRAGHYVAEGEINGKQVTFLLDTGATQVALSAHLANQLGLRRGASVPVQTANGMSQGFVTRLDSVRLGIIEVHDVSALVSEGIDDGIVLLGMSFLKQLEFTQRNDQLILKPL